MTTPIRLPLQSLSPQERKRYEDHQQLLAKIRLMAAKFLLELDMNGVEVTEAYEYRIDFDNGGYFSIKVEPLAHQSTEGKEVG